MSEMCLIFLAASLCLFLLCASLPHISLTADMDLKGSVALFECDKTTVDIFDIATGKVVQQHEVEGTLYYGASVQRNVAAIAVSEPYHGVHLMDIMSGKVLCKFILPNGENATVTLSKDARTLAVGSSTGMS